MSWESEVEDLERRRQLALRQGGKEAIARQHARGRLTIRERIAALLDPDTFEEHGRATAIPDYADSGEINDYVPANYVVGFGKVSGRRIVVGGEDFTLKGGSPNAAGLRKSVYAEHLALQYRVPLIRLLEGGGGSVRGGGRKGGTVGEPVFAEPRFKVIADALGQVPIASAALGAVAGFPAGRLVASHFALMTRHTAQVLIGGPALVRARAWHQTHERRTRRRGSSCEERCHRQHRRRRAGRVQPDAAIPVVPAFERVGTRPARCLRQTTPSAPNRTCCPSCRVTPMHRSTCAASLRW